MMDNQVKDSAGWGALIGSVRDAVGGIAQIYTDIRDIDRDPEPVVTVQAPVVTQPAPTTAAVDWMKQYTSEVNKPMMGLAVVAMGLAGIMFVVNLIRGK